MITPGGSPVLLEQKHVAFAPLGEKNSLGRKGKSAGEGCSPWSSQHSLFPNPCPLHLRLLAICCQLELRKCECWWCSCPCPGRAELCGCEAQPGRCCCPGGQLLCRREEEPPSACRAWLSWSGLCQMFFKPPLRLKEVSGDFSC